MGTARQRSSAMHRGGRDLCKAYSDLMDGWLAGLLDDSLGQAAGDPGGVALVAVGGYGRAELSPQSDIDLLLVHTGRPDIGSVADAIWYPIWNEGLKLGHAVRTPKEALALAADDLDTATSLLEVRHIAGDESLTAEVAGKALAQWRKRAARWLTELSNRVRDRHERAGEVAFLLEPDLKEGAGGMRDVHALRWASAARTLLWEGDDSALDDGYRVLLSARVELHRRTGRPGDVLALQEQDGVAATLGYVDADALMAAVATSGRTIAWRSEDAWQRIDASLKGPLGRLVRRDKSLAPGLTLREGEVHLTAEVDLTDPGLALRAAAIAARRGTRIHRSSLDRLAGVYPPIPEPWPDEMRRDLVGLLLAGPSVVVIIEALDQLGIWVRFLPEWEPVRSRPQRNAYHRFTVDRHLVEAVANAASLAHTVSRPDLLVVGALLHDLGKGYPGDHTDVGVELVSQIGPRLGFGAADVATLQALVRFHLLLPDVATRRDLDDPATTATVAALVGDLGTLELLAALTEADSLATGPAAWGTWKAGLVSELVRRTSHVLGGGAVDELTEDFPTADQLESLQAPDASSTPATTRSRSSHPTTTGCSAACRARLRCTGSQSSMPTSPPSRAWRWRCFESSRASARRSLGRRSSLTSSECLLDGWRSRLVSPIAPAPTRPVLARRRGRSSRESISTTPRPPTPRSWRCMRPTPSASSTASPARWPTWILTSPSPRSRRWAARSSTSSTCETARAASSRILRSRSRSSVPSSTS